LKKNIRNISIAVIQVLIFGWILFHIYNKFSLQDFIDSIRLADIKFIILGFLIILANEVVLGIRWAISCRAVRLSIPFSFFIRGIFIVRFLDYFIPLPAADEIYKVVLLKLKKVDLDKGIAGTLFDKILGFIFLLTVLPLSFIYLANNAIIEQAELVIGIVSIAFLVILLSFIIIKPGILPNLMLRILKLFPGKILEDYELNPESIKYNHSSFIVHYFFITVHFLLQALALVCIFYALGTKIGLPTIIILLPLMILSKILPLSYQGFGLYEAAMVFLMGLSDLHPEMIIMNVSIIHLGITLIAHLMEGFAFIGSGLNLKAMKALRNDK